MFRGTTPENKFHVNLDCRDASVLYITYAQFGQKIIEKTIEDVTITEETITVQLTQEDTLRFCPGKVEVQISVRFPDGKAAKCDIIETTAKRILKEGVI